MEKTSTRDFPSALPSSKLARTTVTGLALAQAGVSRLRHKAGALIRNDAEQQQAQENHDAQIGRILFRALNQLKGTALKVSQLLSMEADFLPEAVRRELAKGCHQVTPLNRALIHKVFQQEFGLAPENLFAHFEPKAFAAASLGQVHLASLSDGSQLAVKVQYPGIAACIGSDIRLLRGILSGLRLSNHIMPRQDIVDRVVSDIEHKLLEEVDYQHEAEQLTWFREHVRLPHIVIPRYFPELSGKRVLSMEKLEGMHLDEWLKTQPTQSERDHFGQVLFTWFWTGVCELGRVHADPHPGNFLFMKDGQLGVLDFGCTKTISPACREAMRSSWIALMDLSEDGNRAALRLAYIDLRLISSSLPQEEFDSLVLPALEQVHTWKMQPYYTPKFDFGLKSAYPSSTPEHRQTLAKLVTGYHPDLPYFDRAYLGLLHMLKKMGAVIDTTTPFLN
ncbi:MAG: AarF/ABC1/UbiB kinase family protein [Undibacterium sp.]|nr:AarF/ABC1/UbiB kinase family protein [Undibacterium sp.]